MNELALSCGSPFRLQRVKLSGLGLFVSELSSRCGVTFFGLFVFHATNTPEEPLYTIPTMASPVTTDPTLERHRQRLEQSLEKLRKALRHWQIFSAEYEAFREELQALPADASREDMVSFERGLPGSGRLFEEKDGIANVYEASGRN